MTSACFSRGNTGFSRNATLVAKVNPPALAGGVFNLYQSISKFIHNYFHHKGDLIFRYGTSKFALLLSDTKLDDILNIVDKIRLSIHSSKIPHDASPLKYITISGGITIIDGHDASYLANPVSELIRLADTAPKDAKKCGMDRINIKKSEFCILSNHNIHHSAF